jgi:hypothetical protein
MDLLTLGIIGGALYLFSKRDETPQTSQPPLQDLRFDMMLPPEQDMYITTERPVYEGIPTPLWDITAKPAEASGNAVPIVAVNLAVPAGYTGPPVPGYRDLEVERGTLTYDPAWIQQMINMGAYDPSIMNHYLQWSMYWGH